MERQLQESTREYVYKILRANIMNLSYAPGSRIQEVDIAEKLNISRTPIREAIIRLVHEKLINVFPQRGIYVSLIDLQLVEESKFIRETLERRVIELACTDFPQEGLFRLEKALLLQELCIVENKFNEFYEHDSNMHGIIFAGCQKEKTWEMIEQMNTHYNRVRILGISHGYELPQLLEEHRAIVNSIRNHDVQTGVKALDEHLNKVRIDLRKMLEDFPEYFRHDD
jgi:DNA-binding GntR family transcriptional regulator